MVPLLTDQDLVDIIVAGLQRKHSNVDLLRVREVGLAEVGDDEVLAWAAEHGRVVVSHDRSTMSEGAYRRVREGLPMLGLVLLPQSIPYQTAIEDLALIALCSEIVEWEGLVTYLPLSK